MSREGDLTDALEGLGLGGLDFYKFGMLRPIRFERFRNALTKKVVYV